jgi:hypothetical protein
MKPSQERFEIARALSVAFQPIIDVCLDIGLTSAELESMVRVAFVQRAFTKLPRHRRSGRLPSDVAVGLAVGLHRNEIAKIRKTGARPRMESKERSFSRSHRLMRGWSTDPAFTTSGGQPLNLPLLRNEQGRSFEELVAKYLPGINQLGSVLKELRRRGLVQVLPNEIIRFRGVTASPIGLNAKNVAYAAERLQRLGSTVLHNIRDAGHRRLYQETKSVKVPTGLLSRKIPLLERSAKAFLDAFEDELKANSYGSRRSGGTRIGASVFLWEEE